MKHLVKKLPIIQRLIRKLDNQYKRTNWIIQQLSALPKELTLLDAGCGTQPFRKYCKHLNYYSQDFGQYTVDEKQIIGGVGGVGGKSGYQYGKVDYLGDIWEIDEQDASFDAILCTEVFEHIPYPIETLKEFSRLLKPGGKLILTAPSNCLRHMDPYFFYSGFSDRWYEKFLSDSGFKAEVIEPIGDYYLWLSVEMVRTAWNHGLLSKIILFPAFIYYFSKKKTQMSVDTLCMGYHVTATKL